MTTIQKRGYKKILGVLFGLLILFSLTHAVVHFITFGTGVNYIDSATISGLAVTNSSVLEQLKFKYNSLSSTSRYIIAMEWLFVLIIILVILVKGRMSLKKDMENVSRRTIHVKKKPGTDLDLLYEVLKQKNSLRLSTISQLFGIKKDTAMEWCKILEAGNLAEIVYPTVGGPKIIIVEKIKKDVKKNEE